MNKLFSIYDIFDDTISYGYYTTSVILSYGRYRMREISKSLIDIANNAEMEITTANVGRISINGGAICTFYIVNSLDQTRGRTINKIYYDMTTSNLDTLVNIYKSNYMFVYNKNWKENIIPFV